MLPIVHGLKKQYGECVEFLEFNAHANGPWQKKLRPFGSPEFYILDAAGVVVTQWYGVVTVEEFEPVLQGVCEAPQEE